MRDKTISYIDLLRPSKCLPSRNLEHTHGSEMINVWVSMTIFWKNV